jgi:ArsR family transcriptional regulator
VPDAPVHARAELACATATRQGTRQVPLPVFTDNISDAEMDQFVENATTASNFLKAISHEGRLLILCHLVSGEKSVTELEDLLSARQAAVSQQLSRLRLEGLVIPRRDGKAIYYRLADDRPKRILEIVYELFCAEEAQDRR